jgi:phage terminase large subunit-like protein
LEDEKNWEKANPNVQFNATLMDFMRQVSTSKQKIQPSKILISKPSH